MTDHGAVDADCLEFVPFLGTSTLVRKAIIDLAEDLLLDSNPKKRKSTQHKAEFKRLKQLHEDAERKKDSEHILGRLKVIDEALSTGASAVGLSDNLPNDVDYYVEIQRARGESD